MSLYKCSEQEIERHKKFLTSLYYIAPLYSTTNSTTLKPKL